MPTGLKRYYGDDYLHFITSSCYQRRPLLGTPEKRDLFLRVLELMRNRYRFRVVGYVVMPEHFHLLINEPERGDPGTAMQVLKQRFARIALRALRGSPHPSNIAKGGAAITLEHFWQKRFYDFVVRTEEKHVEKLKYIHRNPVRRGLVLDPADWRWSSFRHYSLGEVGPILVNE